ncbi:MAG: ABC transporter permease [Pirellulales bacterium]|nr:ABC transporter permease [Pirellulales bacterium]
MPTTFVALLLAFVAIRALPSNPILAAYGQHAVPDQVAQEMERLGWNKPLYEQFWMFVKGLVLDGDLGESFLQSETVAEGLRRTFPATVELALAALLLAIPIGISAGVVAAVFRGRWPDYVTMTGALLGVSIPVFFLGICLLYLFAVRSSPLYLGLPFDQRLSVLIDFQSKTGFILIESLFRGRFDVFWDALRHLVLPAVALSSIPMAVIARITRSSMIEVLSDDYVRTARAKGNTPWRVVMRHAFPNASIPVVNIAGLQLGVLLSGAVLTETVFNWPGLGRYMVDAVLSADYSVVQGAILLIAVVFVLTNVVVDAMYVMLDPRVRLEHRGHD